RRSGDRAVHGTFQRIARQADDAGADRRQVPRLCGPDHAGGTGAEHPGCAHDVSRTEVIGRFLAAVEEALNQDRRKSVCCKLTWPLRWISRSAVVSPLTSALMIV